MNSNIYLAILPSSMAAACCPAPGARRLARRLPHTSVRLTHSHSTYFALTLVRIQCACRPSPPTAHQVMTVGLSRPVSLAMLNSVSATFNGTSTSLQERMDSATWKTGHGCLKHKPPSMHTRWLLSCKEVFCSVAMLPCHPRKGQVMTVGLSRPVSLAMLDSVSATFTSGCSVAAASALSFSGPAPGATYCSMYIRMVAPADPVPAEQQ